MQKAITLHMLFSRFLTLNLCFILIPPFMGAPKWQGSIWIPSIEPMVQLLSSSNSIWPFVGLNACPSESLLDVLPPPWSVKVPRPSMLFNDPFMPKKIILTKRSWFLNQPGRRFWQRWGELQQTRGLRLQRFLGLSVKLCWIQAHFVLTHLTLGQ